MKNKSVVPVITNFPIWEKVYLELNPDCYFENVMGVNIKNLVYVFNSVFNEKNKEYYIFDLESESIKQEEMEYQGCFHPIYDNKSKIYLFWFDSGEYSDNRYSIVEFDVDTGKWQHIAHKGVAPKRRSDDFTTFFNSENKKIYLLGGMQIFPGDNTGDLIYTFNIEDCEWEIEFYSGVSFTEHSRQPYLSNRGGMKSVCMNREKVYLLGGKVLKNSLGSVNGPNNNNNQNFTNMSSYMKPFFNEIESSDILEYDLLNHSLNKKQFTKLLNSDFHFSNCSICISTATAKDGFYLQNKGNFYFFDSTMNELSMLKPLLFNPQPIKDSLLVFYKDTLYIIGKFKHYDDCIIFKTSSENLIPKWNSTKEISYEMLLNNKDCSDIVFLLNAGDKNREILVNKKVMYNFSAPLKNIIINYSRNSNYYNFNDVSFFGVYNTLKFIYSNFNDNISGYDIEIISEMVDIIVRYRARSLLNIALSHIKLNSENALVLYELALKFNFTEFKNSIFNYISENIHSGLIFKEKNVNESLELKRILLENYFCTHSITIQVNTIGFDIKNLTQATVANERFIEIKELCRDNKIYFCLNCKKVVKNS